MIARNYLFHRVHPASDRLWDPMHPKLFDKTIKFITEKYNVVQLEQLYMTSIPTTDKRPLATITFDDGYKDNLEYAAPILHKYKCPASFYLVTDSIEKGYTPWTYTFDYLFQKTKMRSLSLKNVELNESLKTMSWSGSTSRLSYAKELKPYLKRINPVNRDLIMKEVLAAFHDVALPQNMMMNWDDVRQLTSELFVIGSHTKTHTSLDLLENSAAITHELQESAKIIQRELNAFPKTISYPFGYFNSRVIEIAEKCGYKIGLAVDQIYERFEEHELFKIPRVELYNENWIKTKLRITGSLSKIKKLIRR